jgi:hypothetical protein
MVLLALQVFQVLFLWVHDWIPLGRLNDVAAVRSKDTRRRLVTVTLIQSVPWTIGLCFSLLHFRQPYPDWLYDWLVISYGLLFIGQMVGTLSFPTGTGSSCWLSNHVRQNAFLLAAAQWNGPKHGAYPASFGDRRHVDRSSHEVRTTISPRSKLPVGGKPDITLFGDYFRLAGQPPVILFLTAGKWPIRRILALA